MKKIVSTAVLLLGHVLSCRGEEIQAPPALSAEKLEISRELLKPVIAAAKVFEREQPDADLGDFLCWVYPAGEKVRVSFIRERIVEKGPPLKVTRRGASGRSMTVTVALPGFQVDSWSFDR